MQILWLRYQPGLQARVRATLHGRDHSLRDFVVEDSVRRPLGGVFPGERVTHAVMGILYGAALGYLVPELLRGSARATALVPWDAPAELRYALPCMAVGVFLSGLRDLGAAHGPSILRFPWRTPE